ncbi:hypothetical protein SASPL_140472 [Salvia splendens]|uniref:J domain-containing protein n=1 Tax=Salvia splendens TaxID=180675 RepID=A0A8X8ZCI3_SALSN|nr:uncharacterized protein LOC121768870 [Salvia splendens]XP_042021397.1 uncharacterized protein LOC121768870 [Salvia splendens]XP_042021398.1 uncharacterized protein LOC121768870 [Salvia splendens]KAG6398999.1 hypothetical protein SASPL_140472 [Salvia splendens]
MSRISVSHLRPRPRSVTETLRRCRNDDKADKVILIDVDSEISDNVVILDTPESLPKRNKESGMLKKDEKWSFKNVINIDDDDYDDVPSSSYQFGPNNVGFSASTSLNRENFRVAEDFADFTDPSHEDCQNVQDSATPVKLSKCKRTYSGKDSTSNRYGLDTDSECELSGNEYPDCEVVEDFSGKFQELWERAVTRRKRDIRNVHSGIRGHDNTTSCTDKDLQNAESEVATRHHDEPSVFHTTGKSNSRNYGSPPVRIETDFGFTHFSDNAVNDQECRAHGKSNSQVKFCPSFHYPDCEPGSSRRHMERRKDPASSNSSFQEEPNEKFNNPTSTAGNKVNSKEENEDGQVHMSIVCSLPPEDDSLISEREKLKETDEYKRAMEEEWASRQQALQIQAEEAQRERRLRKRKKAESMRMLEMERRQKQRLEEMRSIKQKDEENMNLKDTIRAEVRNQLKQIEVGCQNMASLLHLLGIMVGSWPNPSPQEVHAAYKKALLTFHPDRASRSDIHKLVEAEEKFKFINRMKEKFPPPM